MLGGYNILSWSSTSGSYYWTRTYSVPSTSTYNMVYFVMNVLSIDSIDTTIDFLRVTVASYSVDVKLTYPRNRGHLCGSISYEERSPYQLHIKAAFSGSSLTVTFRPYTDEPGSNESYGFRDIYITLYNSPTTSNSYCGISREPNTDAFCPCPNDKFYQYPLNSGNCYPCHSTCASCTDSGSSDCLSCEPHRYLSSTGSCPLCHPTCDNCTDAGAYKCSTCVGGKFLTDVFHCVDSCDYPLQQSSTPHTDLCKSPCADTEFVYWDRTCSNICKQPLEPLDEVLLYNYFKICEYPCEYEEYLYWNGTCGSACLFPLTSRTKKRRLFCDFTCTDVNKFLYWDAACLDACPFPLSTRLEGNPLQRKFCDYPCLDSQYLYWNGTCMSNCDFPLIPYTYKNKKFCNFTCSLVNQVAYWDGTCQDECDFPKTLISEGSLMVRYYCKFKCDIAEFLYWNGTCSKVCVPPLTYTYKNQRSYCHYPCSSGQYLRWDGVCQSTCPSPLDIRFEAGNHYCDFPCPSTQPYLYWNGSCLASCPYPLQKTAQGSAFFCNFPCNSVNDILYWNGTCATQCQSPLILNTEGTPPRKFCEYNCQKDTQYLYWNGTCSESCDSPLSAEAEAGRKYCRYPCSGSSQYLYWNGSCINQCTSPLTTRIDLSGKQYCDFSCDSATNEYLYWNGTCSPYCLDPLTRETQGSGNNLRHFCIHGCASITDYLYWNGSCQTFCPYPLISKLEGGRRFCYPPCDSVFQFYDTETQTCRTDCPDPYTIDNTYSYARCNAPIMIVDTRGWFTRNILTAPSEPGTVTLIMLPKMLQYVRYLDIRMPPRLQRLALSQGRSLLSLKIGWSMQQDLQERFVQDTLPTVFARHNMHSSFLVNFWPILTTMAIVIFAAIIFTLLEKVARSYHNPTWQSIFESLRILTRWSALIIVFGTNISDVILYTFLQFKTFSDSSWSDYTILGLIICAGVLLFNSIPLILGTVFLAWKAQGTQAIQAAISKEKSPNIPLSFIYKWHDYQILFRGFRTNIFVNRLFYLLYVFRIGLPLVIVSAFYRYPLAVVILQILVNVVIILYVIIMRPLVSKLNMVQLLIIELIALLINISALILTAQDSSQLVLSAFSEFLGDVIIFGSFLQNVIIFLFLGIKLFREANTISSSIRGHSFKEKVIWLQLLAYPLQQAGMGFEEMTKPVAIQQTQFPSAEDDSLIRLNNQQPNPKSKPTKIKPWDGPLIPGSISKLYNQYKQTNPNETN